MSDAEEIRGLLDQGLTFYGLGEVQKALGAWKRVLELEPGNPRALEYIRFVEENWEPNQDRHDDPYRPDEGTDPKSNAEAAAVRDSGGAQAEVFIPPVKSEAGQWGDLYNINNAADGAQAAAPAEAPAQTSPAPPSAPVPEPVAAPLSDPVLSATAPGPAPAVPDQPEGELPAEAEGDEGFASWDSQVWKPAPGEADDPAVEPEAKVEQIESSTLPARPGPIAVPVEIKPESDSSLLPDLPAQAPIDPADAPAQPAEGAQGPGVPDLDADGFQDANPATDGWGTLGKPVKTDPELRIDPGLQSAFSQPPSDSKRVVIKPQPPFADSLPPSLGPVPEFDLDLDADPPPAEPVGQQAVSLSLELSEPLPEPALSLDRFSLDTTPPPAGPSALGLVGGGALNGAEAPGGLENFGADEGSGEFDSVTALMSGVSDMLELDDFSGAVELLDKVLEQDPDNTEAVRLRADAEGELIKMFASKIGDMNRVPEVRMPSDEIIWLNLDNRAGFLLSMIDGQTSYEDIMVVSGLPRLDVMRILVQLLQEKVVDVS